MIGEEAGPDNPIESGLTCFNVTVESDIYKESKEQLSLTLESDDDCVWLGRDFALAWVQANGGTIIEYRIKKCGKNDVAFVSDVTVSLCSNNHLEVNENDGFVEICLEASHYPQTYFEVTLTTVSDTAYGKDLHDAVCVFMHFFCAADEDYVSVNKSVWFAPGLERIQRVPILILNDDCLESDLESFIVSISSNQSCVVADENETTVYIKDDDG